MLKIPRNVRDVSFSDITLGMVFISCVYVCRRVVVAQNLYFIKHSSEGGAYVWETHIETHWAGGRLNIITVLDRAEVANKQGGMERQWGAEHKRVFQSSSVK